LRHEWPDAAIGEATAVLYALSGGMTGSVMSSATALTSAGQAFLGEPSRKLFRAWLPVAAFILAARSAEALLDNLGMRKVFVATSMAWLAYAASLSLLVVVAVEVLVVTLGVVTVVRLERARRAGLAAT
jgi:hypothetical protein